MIRLRDEHDRNVFLDIMSDPDPTLGRDIKKGIKEMKSGKRLKGVVTLGALKKKLKL